MKVSKQKLRIDGHDWSVELSPTLRLDGEPVYGYCKFTENKIGVKSNDSFLQKCEHLFHELFHPGGEDVYQFAEQEKNKDIRFPIFVKNMWRIFADNNLLNWERFKEILEE